MRKKKGDKLDQLAEEYRHIQGLLERYMQKDNKLPSIVDQLKDQLKAKWDENAKVNIEEY